MLANPDARESGGEAAERAHRHAVEIDPLRQDGAGESLVRAEPPQFNIIGYMSQRKFGSGLGGGFTFLAFFGSYGNKGT